MTQENFDNHKLINYWIESSDQDFKTMTDLFNTRNYQWSLFVGHLVIEKLLKALYIQQINQFPPMIHDLRRICEKAGLLLDEQQVIVLDSISRFNLNARYDDYKQAFYKLCTAEFTMKWIEEIKTMRLWIKNQLSN
jgi:HEPN domain-containing protein